MNEKFWDLKKSKQDNMINASLKVFALNGFDHASTDEIVAEAGVSKGLLFHYFYNKVGLYEFLAGYSTRFALVELNSELRRNETLPYFDLMEVLAQSESATVSIYPYLYLFLDRVREEASDGPSEQTGQYLKLYSDKVDSLVDNSILPGSMTPDDAARLRHYLDLIRTDAMASLLRAGTFSPEKYLVSIQDSIRYFRGICS
jgi:AcrR family transcriptional regulator